MGAGCVAPGAILTLPVGNTHYGGHGGPWQGSTEAGGLAPTAQLCSSSPSPDSRETQRKMGRQTPGGTARGGGTGSLREGTAPPSRARRWGLGQGCREEGVEPHLSHRTPSTQSTPLVSSTRLETPRVSWAAVGWAPGECAPDAAGCLGSGLSEGRKRPRAPLSASLGRGGAGQVRCTPSTSHPPLPCLGTRVSPGWSWWLGGSGVGLSSVGRGDEMTYW